MQAAAERLVWCERPYRKKIRGRGWKGRISNELQAKEPYEQPLA